MASTHASFLLHNVDVDALAPAMSVMFEELVAFQAEEVPVMTGRVEPITTRSAPAGVEGQVLVNAAAVTLETAMYGVLGGELPHAVTAMVGPGEVLRLVPEATSAVPVVPCHPEAG